MKELGDTLRSVRLDNGLIIEIFDRSNRYFGDYHRVYVEARCRVVLHLDNFAGSADPAAELQSARAVLGNEVVFVRKLEKMGVAGEAVERTRETLIGSFIRSSLSYMSTPAFPGRFVAVELERRRHGRRPHWPGQ
jgi:hypothetical protein